MRIKQMLRYLGVIGGLSLLIGCGQTTGNDRLGDVNDEELFSQIEKGEAFPEGLIPFIKQMHQPEALGELVNETVLTGEWFLHDGDGQVGFSVISGYQEKQATKNISLYTHAQAMTITDTLKITVVPLIEEAGTVTESEPILVEARHDVLVDDMTDILSIKIPEERGVYLLRLEVVSENDTVTDRLLSVFYNDQAKLDLALEVKDQTDNQAIWAVHNHGQIPVMFGVDYKIETYSEGEWREVPLDLAFIEIALTLAADETYENAFSLEELSSGSYRLVKTIQVHEYKESVTLQAPFTIE